MTNGSLNKFAFLRIHLKNFNLRVCRKNVLFSECNNTYFTFDILYDFTFLATTTLKSDWLAVVTIINQAISHMFHFYL